MQRLCLILILLVSNILATGELSAQCARCPNASFGPAIRTLGPDLVYSYSIVVADFNGDGIPDVAAGVSEAVVVFPGQSDGNFGTPVLTEVPGIGGRIAVGDFNGDGRPDLVVQLYTGEISLLLGGGNLRFLVRPGTGVLALAFAAGDIDGDGRLDVAALVSNGFVVVLRGDGHGNLVALPGVPTGIFGESLAVGDLNGDGFADVVVTDYPSLAVFMGSPAGLGPPAVTPTFSWLAGLTIGDVTGDGKPDVIGTATYPANTVIFPGDGAGGFGAPINVSMGSGPSGYAIADLDSDGKPDLVAVSYQFDQVVLRHGDGAGGFGPARTYFSPSPSSLVVADVDGDGIPDVSTGNGYSVNVALGDGAGGLAALSTAAGEEAMGLVIADFDGDGKGDIATVEGWVPNFLRIRKGHGDGTWETVQDYPVDTSAGVLAAVDLNGDQKPDLVLINNGALQTLLNDGTGHFTPGASSPAGCQPFRGTAAVADFNGDGRPDLALPCDTSIVVRFGDGAGGFAAPVTVAAGARWIAAGDVNGDGNTDLVSVETGRRVLVSLGDGHGGFAAPVGSSLPWFEGLALADFDGDGFLDVAGGTFSNGEFITIGYGDGTGQFNRSRSFPAKEFSPVALSADLDGDGRPDVVSSNGGSVGIFMNDGSGGLLEVRAYGAAGLAIGAGKIDGDGLFDLVAVSSRPPLITTLLNTNCKARHLSFLPATNTCSLPGAPVAPPAAVEVLDDGGNLVTCATGTVTVSLVSGTPGAVLSGTTTEPVAVGLATFPDLSIDLPGAYRLGFAHSGAARPAAGGVRIGSGTFVSIVGPPLVCGSDPAVYDAGAGFAAYVWLLDEEPVAFEQRFPAPFLGPGAHTLSVVARQGFCEGTASTSISNAPPTASSIAPSSGSRGGFTPVRVTGTCIASAAVLTLDGVLAHAVAAPSSTLVQGTTPRHVPGAVDVVVTNPDGQAATLTGAFTYLPGTGAYMLTPCRVLDTRLANGALGGPVLQPHAWRWFQVTGSCGIPAGAVALLVNATVTQPAAPGGLIVAASGLPSSGDFLSFSAGQTRANNGILMMPLDESGSIFVYDDSLGTAHLILDVSGYFY